VSYFASIALLILSAFQPASPLGAGNPTNYFDSVVFKTTILLMGTVLHLSFECGFDWRLG
jgi:hypothetical protein